MTEKNRKLNVLVSGNILQNQLQKCQMVLPTLPDDVDLDEVDKELPWLTSQKKSWSLLLEPSEVSRVFGQLEQPLKVKKITKPIVQCTLYSLYCKDKMEVLKNSGKEPFKIWLVRIGRIRKEEKSWCI